MKSRVLSLVLTLFLAVNAMFFLTSPFQYENEIFEQYELTYELPINGASGFLLARQYLKESPQENSVNLLPIEPGSPFTIIFSENGYLKVEYRAQVGWVSSALAMVNLPDIVPSIIYFNTNSTSSLFQSSGYGLPDIYSQALYDARDFNERFSKEQYIMPVLYRTAIMFHDAQQAALKDGNSLKIYETFRPLDVQTTISRGLRGMMQENQTVREGINSNGWGIGWFISGGVSTHQLGAGADLALVRIRQYETRTTSGFEYKAITAFSEYMMPSKMHELSTQAIVLERPSAWHSQNGFNADFAPTMSVGARRLHAYMVDVGFTPLASEWWHFDYKSAWNQIRREHPSVNGDFRLQGLASRQPTP